MSQCAKILLLSSMIMGGCGDMDDMTALRGAPGSDELCRVQLHDSFNEFTTELTAESSQDRGALDFIIINETEDEDDTIPAHFDRRNALIETDVSVDEASLNDIRRRFKSLINTFATTGLAYDGFQLTYTQLSGDCSRDEFALIHFFVMEWFYFG